MNTNAHNVITTMIFSLAMLAATGPALADNGKRVDFENLDPGSATEVAALYERITEAAEQVCRQATSPWDGRKISHFEACVKGAVDQAVRDINLGMLTDLHQGSHEEKLAGR